MAMHDPHYWKAHYVLGTDADEIERSLNVASFASGGRRFELPYFERGKGAPCILISPGSGGHSYVFAELGYQMSARGYNVFIMPKQGDDFTIAELVRRQGDAAQRIASEFNDRIGAYGEGLGGFVTFYLGLGRSPLKSIICQNAPAILTEERFRAALGEGGGAARRRKRLLPLFELLARAVPKMRLPIRLYLDWKELIDTKEANRRVETRLVDGYMGDPDFDRWYTLSAILSQTSTPPPSPVTELATPTMFLVPVRGVFPSYIRGLFERLPPVKKRMVEVDGGVYWMLSHPLEATKVVCDWFDETVRA